MKRKDEIKAEIKEAQKAIDNPSLMGFQSMQNKYMIISGYICALKWVLEDLEKSVWEKIKLKNIALPSEKDGEEID